MEDALPHRQHHGTSGLEPTPDIVQGAHLESLRLQHLEQVLGDAGGGMLLEDPYVPVARDIVFEALELDASIGRRVADSERGEVRKAAVGAHRAELPRL